MRKALFLFGQLNDDDVEWMLRAGQKRFVPAGGVLIEQGVAVDSVFILLEGKLAVSLRPRREPERELARLNAGETPGAGVAAEGEEEEADADELDSNVLGGVYLTGERFDRMVKRVLVT